MNDFWIVSFDGGGVRYVIELILMRRILEKFPQLESKFKLLCGTSAGGLVAAAIATKGFTEAYKFLMSPEFMKQVFLTSYSHSVYSVNGWHSATYKSENLCKIVSSQFSETDKIGDWPKSPEKPHLLITSFCISRKHYEKSPEEVDQDEEIDENNAKTPHLEWAPRIYHTIDKREGHGHILMRDVLIQTASAPTYFPSWKGCVDGGVAANNPSMLGLTASLRYSLIQDVGKIHLLSIGSGVCPSNMDAYPANADLGKYQWLPHLFTMFIDANTEITVVECLNLLGENRFNRVQIPLPRAIALEEYTAFEELKNIAENYNMDKTFTWIEKALNPAPVLTNSNSISIHAPEMAKLSFPDKKCVFSNESERWY